jgi:hypothetical protein
LESQGSLFLSSGKTVCTDHFIAVEVYLTTHLPALHEALQGGVRVDLIAFRTPVRAGCNYKIRTEFYIGEGEE